MLYDELSPAPHPKTRIFFERNNLLSETYYFPGIVEFEQYYEFMTIYLVYISRKIWFDI
uniref:Uncharacterized protein n=1 Tax=Rhizophagus irregularis (strain DAOM 181602 / DAOM 197198 / MUCL 43194) TaxID=747089 RepID=U9SZF5_RHIID